MDEGNLVYSRKLDETRYKKAVSDVIRSAQLAGPLPERSATSSLWQSDSEPSSPQSQNGGSPKNYTAHAPFQFGMSTSDTARGPLVFSSSFEAGNLASARYFGKDDEDKHEYELHMEGDTHAAAHTQWYNYIAVSRSMRPEVVVFKIVNFRKKRSLHSCGMQPYVYSEQAKHWDPLACTNVLYGACASGPRTRGTFVLTFTYTFQPQDTVQFAMYPPYSYTALRRLTSMLLTHKQSQKHVTIFELCRSIGGVPVPLLHISHNMGEGKSSKPMRPMTAAYTEIADKSRKRAVVIIARQHAGEVVCSYMVEGLIRFLIGPSREAVALRDQFIFHIVPMVNVDGVIYGNSRCTLAGKDPNRIWCDPNPIMHPVVYSLKEYLRKVQEITTVELFLDFHGHSQKCGTFFYGCGSTDIRNAIFPKIASLATQDIHFDECRWRIPGRGHSKTARHVIYKQLDIPYSYTIESSFFADNLPSPQAIVSAMDRRSGAFGSSKEYPFSLFTPFRVETVGMAIGKSMACFFKLQQHVTPAAGENDLMLPDPNAFFHSPMVDSDTLLAHQGANYPWLTPAKLCKSSPDDILGSLVTIGSTVLDLTKDSDDAGGSHSSEDENNTEAKEGEKKGDKEKDKDKDKDKDKEKDKGKDRQDRKRNSFSKPGSKKTPRERRRTIDEPPLTAREPIRVGSGTPRKHSVATSSCSTADSCRPLRAPAEEDPSATGSTPSAPSLPVVPPEATPNAERDLVPGGFDPVEIRDHAQTPLEVAPPEAPPDRRLPSHERNRDQARRVHHCTEYRFASDFHAVRDEDPPAIKALCLHTGRPKPRPSKSPRTERPKSSRQEKSRETRAPPLIVAAECATPPDEPISVWGRITRPRIVHTARGALETPPGVGVGGSSSSRSAPDRRRRIDSRENSKEFPGSETPASSVAPHTHSHPHPPLTPSSRATRSARAALDGEKNEPVVRQTQVVPVQFPPTWRRVSDNTGQIQQPYQMHPLAAVTCSGGTNNFRTWLNAVAEVNPTATAATSAAKGEHAQPSASAAERKRSPPERIRNSARQRQMLRW